MKTKELIELLQKEDPTGETEVCFDNMPIAFVQRLPAAYDGHLERFDRPFPNVSSASFVSTGEKIRIHAYGIEDVLVDDPEIPVDCLGKDWLEDMVQKWREEYRDE